MIVLEDWPAGGTTQQHRLLRELRAAHGAAKFAERHQDPLVLGYINRIFGYKPRSPGGPVPQHLGPHRPEFRGKVMIRDVAITGDTRTR